jgi:hypothetical protein
MTGFGFSGSDDANMSPYIKVGILSLKHSWGIEVLKIVK